MAEPTIVSWTPANMITVTLMVAVVFFALAAASKVYRQQKKA